MRYCPKCKSKLTRVITDGIKRLACSSEQCSFVHWNNPVPVVAALVKHEGNYIIARNTLWPTGIFSLIAGYLERQETPEQAVLREVKEELGLNGEIRRYLGHYSFFEKNQLIICYEINAIGALQTNDELAEIKRLTADELRNYDFSPLYITETIIRDWKTYNDKPKV